MPEYLAPGVYVEEAPRGPRTIVGASTSTAGFVGQTERGPVAPRLITSWSEFVAWYGGFHGTVGSFLPFSLRGFFDNGGRRAYVARVHRSDTTVAGRDLATSDGAQRLRIDALGPGRWGGRLFVRIGPDTQARPDRFRLTIAYYATMPPTPLIDPTDRALRNDADRREPDVFEDFDGLGLDPAGPDYALTPVNAASRLVKLAWVDADVAPARPGDLAFATLIDFAGSDGTSPIGIADYVGNATLPPDQRTGLGGIETIDEVSILCVPDEVHASLDENSRARIRAAVVDQCSRRGDRFAVLQVPSGQGDINAIAPPMDSAHAAIYYPWIRVDDPRTGATELVPPGGHIAGIYARTDNTRGVHKAPANEVVRGIAAPGPSPDAGPLERTITKAEQDILNPKGINVIRDFTSAGRGIRVWGARTISSDPEWKYVNVRRLFLFLEESIDKGTRGVVFEQNDEPTWAAVRTSVAAGGVRDLPRTAEDRRR